MNKNNINFIALILLLIGFKRIFYESYPKTEKVELIEIIHGYEVQDNYRWLEDFTSEDSKDWVERQNKFTQKFIGRNKYKKSISQDLSKNWETESIAFHSK